MVLKFVAVGAGVAIVGTSVGAVVTDGFGYWKTIHWQPLIQDSEYYSGTGTTKTVNSAYNNKFGGTYGKYLTGSDKKNEGFWNNKYKLLKEDTSITTGKFKTGDNLDKGFGDSKSLNKVCEEAYKATESTGFADSGSDNTKFKKSEVWKYCSPGTLTNLEEDKKGGEGAIGKAADNSKLLSTTSKDNDWFWKIRNEDFWSTDSSNEWSGTKATGSGDTDKSLFKKEYETKNNNNDGTRKTIRELCEEAYKEQTTSASSNNSKDAKRFCVLEKTA